MLKVPEKAAVDYDYHPRLPLNSEEIWDPNYEKSAVDMQL